ncbi:MAG: hypothetical protein OXH59_04900 [Rhodospirillaceae bacterium]|nr:hypothetical protein [Rhodospirillaceae bacterium]
MAVIPSWFSAVTFWKEVVAVHWLVAPISITVLTVWATLAVQRIWRQGVLQRWYRNAEDFVSALDPVSALGFRSPTDRAFYVRGFIRMLDGKEPPDPLFKGSRCGAKAKRPWSPFVPRSAGDLWVATAFAYPNPVSGIYMILPSKKAQAWGEQYSIDAEAWRKGDRLPTDRYMRYREAENGDLSDPIILGARTSNQSPKAEWLRLTRTTVRGGHTEKTTVPPIKLSAVKALRVVVQTYGSKFVTAETTLSAIEQLKPIAPDANPEMTRLVCTINEHVQSNALEAVVRSPVYHLQHDGLRFAIDFIGDPDTGVVDAIAVEGVIPMSGPRYHDIVTLYFR